MTLNTPPGRNHDGLSHVFWYGDVGAAAAMGFNMVVAPGWITEG